MHMIGKGEIRYTVFLAYPVRELLWLCKTCISRLISSPQMKATTSCSAPCFFLLMYIRDHSVSELNATF